MKISDEKTYLYQMMQNIVEERRKLTDMYYELHQRIQELNKMQEHGIDTLSIEGYADLHNKLNKQLAENNIQRELISIAAAVRQEVENQSPEETRRSVAMDEDKEVVIPFEELDRAKQMDKPLTKLTKKKQKTRQTRIPKEKSLHVVKSILTEHGAPMEARKIYKAYLDWLKLTEESYTYQNFRYNLLPRIMKEDTRLEMVSKGIFQFRF